jgi:methionyl-tRNA synthetase
MIQLCICTSFHVSCRAQTEICQGLFQDLWQAGNISEQVMEQLYSEAAGKFLADRFVSGTCPKCGYEVRRRNHRCKWM